jgi:hypothetical protein
MCLLFGLYIGVGFKPVFMSGRGPASVRPTSVSDTELLNYFKNAGMNKVAAIYRKAEGDFRAVSLGREFHEVGKFDNFQVHQQWLTTVAQRLSEKSTRWRGVGTVMLGGQSADVELILTTSDSCFEVDAFIRLNGALTPLASSPHCAADLLYREGDYYLSWSVYDQFQDNTDLSLLNVALPQSNSETLRYLIDGEREWQISSIAWTQVSAADGEMRIGEISQEMLNGGR